MNKYRLNIGDYHSGEGMEEFIIQSTDSVESLREYYFLNAQFCNDNGYYAPHQIFVDDDNTVEEGVEEKVPYSDAIFFETNDDGNWAYIDADAFCKLVIDFINWKFNVPKVTQCEEFIPDFNFYGVDDVGRNLPNIAGNIVRNRNEW